MTKRPRNDNTGGTASGSFSPKPTSAVAETAPSPQVARRKETALLLLPDVSDRYAEMAASDSLELGEAPLYCHPDAAVTHSYMNVVENVVAYVDCGITDEMSALIKRADDTGKQAELRTIGEEKRAELKRRKREAAANAQTASV